MTRIRFYTEVAEPAPLLLRLCLQALQKQRQVTLLMADAAQARVMSDALWQLQAESFVPHALATEPHAAQSPVVLAWQAEHITQDDLLFNCQSQQPMFFGRFRHLFEIVSTEEAVKAAARQRWAFYRERGYQIEHLPSATLVS